MRTVVSFTAAPQAAKVGLKHIFKIEGRFSRFITCLIKIVVKGVDKSNKCPGNNIEYDTCGGKRLDGGWTEWSVPDCHYCNQQRIR